MRAVREAVGPGVTIMVDATETWSVTRAIRTGKALQDAGVVWIEDPVSHTDVAGMARVTAALDVPVATGEHLYQIADFHRLLEARGTGIALIDLGRIGGVTPWRHVASLAHGFGVPVGGHVLPEIHVHLLTAVPNAQVVEYVPRSASVAAGDAGDQRWRFGRSARRWFRTGTGSGRRAAVHGLTARRHLKVLRPEGGDHERSQESENQTGFHRRARLLEPRLGSVAGYRAGLFRGLCETILGAVENRYAVAEGEGAAVYRDRLLDDTHVRAGTACAYPQRAAPWRDPRRDHGSVSADVVDRRAHGDDGRAGAAGCHEDRPAKTT